MVYQITWLFFLKFLAGILIAFWLLKFLFKAIPFIAKRKSTVNNLTKVFNIILEGFKPIAIFLIILTFIAINYKVHGTIFLVILIISFSYIKSYLHGVVFKTSPIVGKGVQVSIGKYVGEINKILPFGIILKSNTGERFVNYSFINNKGYNILHNEHNSNRSIVFLSDKYESSEILDVLFENPIINFEKKPNIISLPEFGLLQLQFTLEKGVKIETIMAFLKQNNFESSLTKN